MPYRAPVSDMIFMMNAAAGLQSGIEDGTYADLADGIAEATLNEAAKFAENVLAPLHRTGDQIGAAWKDGVVTTSPGWPDAYRQFVAGGWQSVTGGQDHGGMGLPQVLLAGCLEMWSAANMAFILGPVLTFGAIDALEAHASDEIKHTYLERMISGEWPATMNLTEPGAGSDLNPLRTKAERAGDGTYRIAGQKIFITYGEHDMAENIVHLVLARLPDARRAPRASRCSSCQNSWSMPTARSARATTCVAPASNTSSAYTARRPASWSTETMAARPAISSARRIAVSPACSQ